MLKFIIYKDDEKAEVFEHQEDSSNPFRWLLNHQGQSIHYALKYGGYKVEQIDEETEKSTFWEL